MNRSFIALFACMLPLLANAEGWQFSISPYLWLPSLSLDSSEVDEGGDPGGDPSLGIGPIDYLDALDFAFMVTGDMRRQDWVVMADFLYADFEIDDKEIDLGRPGSGPLDGTYNAELSGSIVGLAGGRTLMRSNGNVVDGLAGWRQFNMTLDLSAEFDAGGGFGVSSDIEFNDAFLAINGRASLGDTGRWSLRYYADVGAGDSDLTWQARLGLVYAYGWGDLFFDYRHLDYDFGENGELKDLTGRLTGPLFGATFRFGGDTPGR